MIRLTVAVRVRPLSVREVEQKSISIVSVDNEKTISVTNIKVPEQNAGDSRERIRRFTFDYCFDYNSTQDDVFQALDKEVSKAIKQRFHSCILAYGQSSSGKTHTMIGIDDDGLAPRLCQNIFNYLSETAVGSEAECLNATVSYLEIYNEKVRDLLNQSAGDEPHHALKIREHPKKGPYVQGLFEQTVLDASGLLNCLQRGNANRTVGATNANPRSSRSHSVFTVTCCGGVKLRLVDLAGSERAGSRSHTTSRFREGSNINKSLVALRNVISALAEGSRFHKSRKRFIPYRDSILTWLLKDTLGGNSKTILISTISPSSTCYNETVNTLRFGQRAKQIVVQPLVNEDPKERTIRELRAEIARLKDLLAFNHIPKLTDEQSECSHCNKLKEKQALLEEESWEETEDLQSDSGLASSAVSFEDEEDELFSANTIKVHVKDDVKKCSEIVVVDKLIPVMEVTANVDEKRKAPAPLRRTFSMDIRGDIKNPKLFGSHEGLSALDKKKNSIPSRKTSIDKAAPSLKGLVAKVRNDKFTETAGGKIEAKAKVDSIRKPRKDVVAAVTQRLYNKVKKKEASTDTDDINREPPKKLTITEGARMKLQELTRKALKASKRRVVETQTDGQPILRVKEMATDVHDLKIVAQEMKNVEISTNTICFKDVGISCNNGENECKRFVMTRTCGTSTIQLDAESSTTPSPNPLSFMKYLQVKDDNSKIEIVNPSTANPIYTSSVNINVNHNYINRENKLCDNASDDSLEEPPYQPNICFPTPDLISNHNSLEQHAHEPTANYLHYASINTTPEQHYENVHNFNKENGNVCVANCSFMAPCNERLSSIRKESVYASQTCIQDGLKDNFKPFHEARPTTFRPNIIQDFLHEPIASKPTILKSIMKQNLPDNESDDSLMNTFSNIPDSLNYYYEKKKVHFDSPFHDERMYDVMTNFMKEVTTLMTNLTRVTNRLDNALFDEQNFDVQVTLNDIHGLSRSKYKPRKKCKRSKSVNVLHSECTQTSPIKMCDITTEIDEDELPVNKYEELVTSSCDRLEKLLQKATHADSEAFSTLHKFPQPFSVNDWNYRSLPEDSSLDSNPTFSDYGSLPRRRYTRDVCTPSSYLRQLTSMRKQIVKSSRDELLNESQMHLQ